ADEFTRLQDRRKIERLYEKRASQISEGSFSFRDSHKKVTDSQIKHSTRKALGASFDSRYSMPRSSGYHCKSADRQDNAGKSPITQHIIEEFNKRWLEDDEDDEDDEADQFAAGSCRDARWRLHQPIFPAGSKLTKVDAADQMAHVALYKQMYGPESLRKLPEYREGRYGKPLKTLDTAMKQEVSIRSSFDWD
ncbi:hypothetical protein EJ04DRAFT_344688, partial [Polyplosphaeria fusca]